MNQSNSNIQWKVISSKYISREPWFTVRAECVELPNGNRIPSYYVLDYPEWVNVIAITKEGMMVMVQQYRHGIGLVGVELVAGTCEETDASPLESAKRELLEESGYGNGTWSEFSVLSANPSTHSNLTHTFLAENVELLTGQNLDAGEDLTVHLFQPHEVLQMLQRGEILQSLMAAPLWRYFYEKNIANKAEKIE